MHLIGDSRRDVQILGRPFVGLSLSVTADDREHPIAESPHLVTPVLRGRDIPREAFDEWPRGATVFQVGMSIGPNVRADAKRPLPEVSSGMPDAKYSQRTP